MTDKRVDILVSLVPLIPYVAQGIADAIDTYNKFAAALKDGSVSDDEMLALRVERDAVIQRIIAKTTPTPSPAPEAA